MRLSILFLSLFSIVLLSCSNKKTSNNEVANDQIITEKYWKLITLDGQDVEMVKNQEREAFFILREKDETVSGFAGCNNIMGEFALEDENEISFNNMGTTLMMCPDVDIDESEFLNVFENADNFTIHNDTLELYAGENGPLARFVAVYF